MATAGNFSHENENFCRYFRLVNETSAKPLRKLIEITAATHNLPVDAFVLKYRGKMQTLKSKGIIQKHQFDTIFPKSGPFQIANADISLLCVILKNTCRVSPTGEAAYEDIRKFRNELCHNPVISLTRLEYYSKFSNVHGAIKTLLRECQDVVFETDIENEIKNIDESPISIAPVLNLFKEFVSVQDSKTARTIDDKIRQLEKSTDEKIKDVYATVEKQTAITENVVQQILQSDSSLKDVNQMVKTLMKQTEAVLSRKSEFVLTRKYSEAENTLLSSGSVVICGGTGEGKTNAAYEIMRRKGNENNCLQIHSPDDVRFVDPRIFDFIFIDDIFGNYEVDESKLQSWIHVMEKLQHLVNAKAINLIIATREIVLKECKKNLEKFSIFNNTVSLSSKHLSEEEKTEILDIILKSKKRHCTPEEKQRCILNFCSDLGFPYTCVLFASDDNFFRAGASFFKHNPFMNLDLLTKVHDCKLLALLFLWIKDATNPAALNRSKENDDILKSISRLLRYEYAIDILYDRVNEQCKIMEEVFVNAGTYGYQFTHNAVYQSIGYHFARIGHYDLILKHCNLAFFMEAITVTEDHYRSDRVFIRNGRYQNLVDRIIIEVIERKHCRQMAMHPCLTREIIGVLFQTLKKDKRLKDFFLSSESEFCSSNTFLSSFLETCATESCSFLKQLLDQLKCPKVFHKKKQCKICTLFLDAYHAACRGGNIDALKLLNFVKFDSSILSDAALSRNVLMYDYILKILGTKKDVENEKRALYIAIENNDLEMFHAIQKKGCMPDSKCLMIASKVKSSALIVRILRDLHDSDALNEDKHVLYTKSTIFSIDVLETFIDVGLCPTKGDIVRSMTADIKAAESILWNLKYKVNESRYANTRVINLWSDVIADPDLKEKLEEIGLLETTSYLDLQVKKGNSENVDHIIKLLQENEDWDPESVFAENLLNISLPIQKDMFMYLLNIGVLPSYTTLLKSITTKDINIVKMTIDKMKDSGTFNPSCKGAKQALLLSTLSCKIYNYLIEEGIKIKAYHFLYTVESDICVDKKMKIIKNLYSKAEQSQCIQTLDKSDMQLALLGAFDDIDVYTCLLKSPFKLPSSILPTIASRGSVTQLERFIANLKDQKDWPPPFDTVKLSLKCSFFNPVIFEILMKENYDGKIAEQHGLLNYQTLFECRMHSFHNIKEYISILKKNNMWDPSDIVLKCSLLESSDDQEICELFQENGVKADDILDAVYITGNFVMHSYITAYLYKKGQKINFENCKEETVECLSRFPHLCTDRLLSRAVEVSEREVVLKILETLNDENPDFAKSKVASHIIQVSSERLEIYCSLLDVGFTPTIQCLLNVMKNGSYELFCRTIKCIDDFKNEDEEFAKQLVSESVKLDTRFYVTLSKYGFKGNFEDIILALNEDNIPICNFIVNDIQNSFFKKCPEGIDIIILKSFPLYKRMHEKGLQVTSTVLHKLTKFLLEGQVNVSNICSVFKDYFSRELWSFEDAELSDVYKLSKGNADLFSFLDIYFKSEKESFLLNSLMTGDKETIEMYLTNDLYNSMKVLPGVIRKSLISRKRIDKCCTQLIMEWIERNECDQSLKILFSVVYSDSESTLQILYALSEKMKTTLDTKILETALEEATFNKKWGLYCALLKECHVEPTTYCLLYSLYHDNDTCFHITVEKLPRVKKTCQDPYYKTSLALCCQRSYIDKFKILLSACQVYDAELVYEAVLCKNELVFKLVQEMLIKHNLWDFSLKEYWIASALTEANEKFSILFEEYYDDTFNETSFYEIQDEKLKMYQRTKLDRQELMPLEDKCFSENSDSSDRYAEHEYDHIGNGYEELDSFISHEKAYSSLRYIQRE